MSERWLIGALVIGAAIYLLGATSIPLDPWAAQEAVNTRTLPIIYGATLLILSGALLLRPGRRPMTRPQRPGVVVALVVTMLMFTGAVALLGVWLAIPVLLIPSMLLLGERRWWLLSGVPASTALLTWGLVTQALGVFVPPGLLFG